MARGIERLRADTKWMQGHLVELEAAQARTKAFYGELDANQRTIFDLFWHEVHHRASGHDDVPGMLQADRQGPMMDESASAAGGYQISKTLLQAGIMRANRFKRFACLGLCAIGMVLAAPAQSQSRDGHAGGAGLSGGGVHRGGGWRGGDWRGGDWRGGGLGWWGPGLGYEASTLVLLRIVPISLSVRCAMPRSLAPGASHAIRRHSLTDLPVMHWPAFESGQGWAHTAPPTIDGRGA